MKKRMDEWLCDRGKGHTQCPYVISHNGGYLHCIYREHPGNVEHYTDHAGDVLGEWEKTPGVPVT